MASGNLVSCPGVLALELPPQTEMTRLALERDEAETLAGHMADDLRELLPDVQAGKLAVSGAHFDSTELLRPDFPVFTTLETLASGLDAEVVAFGNRDGRMPAEPLVPDATMQGAALRLIPFTLMVPPDQVETLGAAMETELVGRGEAGTRTADWLMRCFDVQLEHARYFSRHDLLALVCVHYEHVNLAPLWTLVEAALLTPEREETTLSAHGLTWRQVGSRAIAQSPGDWLARQTDVSDPAHELAGIVFELRQYVALLQAHRIPIAFESGEHASDAGCLIETRIEPDAAGDTPRLYAHEATGLGVVALTVAQQCGVEQRILAHAWLLSTRVADACRHLADRFGCASEAIHLGEIMLDTDGRLAVSRASVH